MQNSTPEAFRPGFTDYASQQRRPSKHLPGIAIVILLHIILVWALVNGLARKVVEVVKGPLETKIIQEVKPPPPDTPPPPPPKLAPPPPPFIPPPEVNIANAPAPTNAISVTTSQVPAAPAPQAPPAPKAEVHKAPVVKASGCREPEYPSSSERLGESGRVVLSLLVGTDGKVTDSKVETSSGFPRLDEAARSALSLCKFTPGTVDGQPEQAWAKIAYVFKNPNR
jgi:periplasmic protein TonB